MQNTERRNTGFRIEVSELYPGYSEGAKIRKVQEILAEPYGDGPELPCGKAALYLLDASRGYSFPDKTPAGGNDGYRPVRRKSPYAALIHKTMAEHGAKYSSLSHCGPYCVGISSKMPCGIDVEMRREFPAEWIPPGFTCSSREFLKEWTALECYVKMEGATLSRYGTPDRIDRRKAVFIYPELIPGYELCVCFAPQK